MQITRLYAAAMRLGLVLGAAIGCGSASAAAQSVQQTVLTDLNVNDNVAHPWSVTPVGGTLFFNGSDPTHSLELWRTNGTLQTTRLVKDIQSPGTSIPRELTRVNDLLYFSAIVSGSGYTAWRSDGTENGTHLLVDPLVTTSSTFREVQNYFPTSNGAVFSAGVSLNATTGYGEDYVLWGTDGSSGDATALLDLGPAGAHYGRPLTSTGTLAFAYKQIVEGNAIVAEELWQTDGTSAGTQPLAAPAEVDPRQVRFITPLGSRLIYHTLGEFGEPADMWITDGTAAGSLRLVENAPSELLYGQRYVETQGRVIAFPQFCFGSGRPGELHSSDGTPEGTSTFYTFGSADQGAEPSSGTPVANGNVFFLVFNTPGDFDIWQTDGTSTGTTLAVELGGILAPDVWFSPSNLVYFEDAIYFVISHEHNPDLGDAQSLWRALPGEAPEQVLVAPGNSFFETIRHLTVIDDTLFAVMSTSTTLEGQATAFELVALQVPEPASALLVGGGFILFALRRPRTAVGAN